MNRIYPIYLFAAAMPLAAFANLPHAFQYGDKAFADVPAVEKSVQDVDGRRKVVYEWTSPDGKLLLRTTETVYKNFPVREYLPELVTIGDAPTEIVDDFRPISLSRTTGGATVRALHGTVGRDKDFEPVTVAFGEKGVGAYSFVATEGRSSAQWMPWLGLDFPEGDGLEIAVGWSGAWRADAALANGSFAFSAGMVKTHFRLLPGETVRQPSVLVFTRKAGVSPRAMQTLVHRFMLDEKCPRDAQGRLIKPILPITSGGGNKTPAKMRKIIDWCAYQMHRSDLDAGFVVCFRRIDAPSHVFTASLGGIDPSARYTVEAYEGTTEQMDGRALANFTADLKSPRSFRLVFYLRTK